MMLIYNIIIEKKLVNDIFNIIVASYGEKT